MWRNWMLVPALVLVLTLSACGETASSTEEAAQGELSEARVEAAGRPLSEEEIISAYDRAVTAYSWFVVSPLPDTGQTVSQDGRIYRRVDGMEELEDLRIYLNGLFAPEVTERLLATGGESPMYRDIDGALYVTGQGRERDPLKGKRQVEAQQVSDGEYSVNVTVDLLDRDGVTVTGLESWSFPYVYTGERWVFTDFHLIY